MLSPVAAAGSGGAGAGFMKAPVLTEVSLAQGGAAFSGSPRAVALAAGTLDPTPKELVRSMTKQVPHNTIQADSDLSQVHGQCSVKHTTCTAVCRSLHKHCAKTRLTVSAMNDGLELLRWW